MAWLRMRLTEEQQRVVNEERSVSSQPTNPREDARGLAIA